MFILRISLLCNPKSSRTMSNRLKRITCRMTLSHLFAGILCFNVVAQDASPVIPRPQHVRSAQGSFTIDAKTKIVYPAGQEAAKSTAEFLADLLRPSTGLSLPITAGNSVSGNQIRLELVAKDTALGTEGYQLAVTGRGISLKAATSAGLFYGVQTLRQLLPEAVEAKSIQSATWMIPAQQIHDRPEYGFRGAMLDVARHFFGVDEVKRFIDLIAAFKMNVLHLHLSDDQGWRIEIKSWPKLTEIGGSTQVGGGKGGYYTQEQYKDIVAYAASRHVTIIPEIDMPGHTNAAIVSYPELNCRDTTIALYTGTEVGFSTFCTNRPGTYKFIDDVLRELATITPGPWLHIGGDESHVTPKKDYITFMNQVQPMVSKYGKQVIGWDEIAHADLQKNTVVQYWADAGNSKMAVKKGAKVIMSPAKKAYLDMQYDSTTRLGLHWAGYVEVDAAYQWDPATLEAGIGRQDILGVETPLWTETIVKMDDIEYMVFPRLPGIAEIGWTAPAKRDWNEYRTRLGRMGARFSTMGIDYYPSQKVDWKK
jgi:hexosaminidase